MKKARLFLFVLTTIFSTTAVHAQTPNPTNTTELAAFLDPLIQEEMSNAGIPGSVIVIVKDGQILFNEGYGYVNLESREPVDSDITGFRVASLTKLFTATAVLQLAERGQIDLHTDINQYLPFTIPATYDDPITLHHLLTHSSGLDDRQIGDAAYTPADVISLADYLAHELPDRIHPPGAMMDYSNHGYALAGYIVEVVSGMPFADYVAQEILRPLTMTHSTLQQPPSPHIQLATGYSYVEDNPPRPEPLDYSNVAPADALIASGTDMAQFMLAHLQTDDSSILSATTSTQMHQTQFTHHPQLRGRTYGYIEWIMNGRRLLTHTGGQLGFASLIALYPEENLGIFIAQNGRFGNLRFNLLQQFMDHYYPALETPSATNFTPSNLSHLTGLSRLTGHYRSLENYFSTTFEKVATIFGAVEEVEIKDNGDGTLTIWDDWQLQPIEDYLFQLDGRSTRAYFQAGDNGHITHLFINETAYSKLAWYEVAAFHRMMMRIVILLLATAVLILPLTALRRWRQSQPAQPAAILAFLIGLLAVAFFLSLDLSADQLSDQIDYGVPTFFIVILTLPILSTLLTVPLTWLTVRMWVRRQGLWIGRFYLTLLTLAAILYALILQYWNLLGYHF